MLYIGSALGNIESLAKCLEADRLRINEPMSLHTTIQIGGPADLFYITETSGDLVKAVRLCRSFSVPMTVIGEGSGVIVSDKGIRGLVIYNKSERIQVRQQRRSVGEFLRRVESKNMEVTVDSGVQLSFAIEKLHSLGINGFDSFEVYKGTVGGVVVGGLGGEDLKKISIIDSHGAVKSVGSKKELGGCVVTDATFVLEKGKVRKNRVKSEKDRDNQQKKTVFKVFEDINEEERQIFNYPSRDVGYVIGEVLNLKGFSVGKIRVSKTNQNSIENLGGGTAKDFVKLIEEIKRRARESLGIELVESVVRVGEW
jgi:UDP-N-acetylmuramate dehydrogenase